VSVAAARVRAYVGIGANLGDAADTVRAAAERLRPLGLRRLSSLYRSAPVDASGPDFVNAVAELDSPLPPLALLRELQVIEQDFGRERPYRNAPRTLDLDLLLYGEESLASEPLTLPHPRLHERAFVVDPLLELVPGLVVPGLGLLAEHRAAVAGQRLERMGE
jgi:2-amino-4-hydroxy-6-hydroxymethyldihydropteridine diphosphokinase